MFLDDVDHEVARVIDGINAFETWVAGEEVLKPTVLAQSVRNTGQKAYCSDGGLVGKVQVTLHPLYILWRRRQDNAVAGGCCDTEGSTELRALKRQYSNGGLGGASTVAIVTFLRPESMRVFALLMKFACALLLVQSAWAAVDRRNSVTPVWSVEP